MSLTVTDAFKEIVLEMRPLIDVRAPVEFEQGSFPDAVNLPLMNDEERRLVGICYKEQGNEAAVALGHKLVGDEIKTSRIEAWKSFIKAHPDAYLYCFRGGQRSQIAQQWLHDAGIEITRLKGGYKAFRHFLMEEALRISAETPTLILGGRTGSGKTLLLHQLDNAIDLEGLAHHRGSSFGRYIEPQPTQIDFEDALSYALIHFEASQQKKLVIEHESHNIGRIYIPKPIYQNFLEGSLILLETSLSQRVDITFDEYVVKALVNYQKQYQDRAAELWAEDMLASFKRIKKRLGGKRYQELTAQFDEAFGLQKQEKGLDAHKSWVQELLEHYYDPMYDYQIEKSTIPILFRGNAAAVSDFIKQHR